MPTRTITTLRAPAGLSKPVELTLFALCVANALYLAVALLHGTWLVGANGLPIATDFVNVWAGGQQVWAGHPTAAYDPAAHKAAQVAALRHDFDGEYPWVYPPTFFFAAALVATMPLAAAHVIWAAATFAGYAAAMAGIMRGRISLLFACAFPGIVANVTVGQNGFVTAALIGGMLVFLRSRPVLAGILLGLLSFKPHFGVLIPLVLLASGHWRVLMAAAATTALLALAAWLAFGFGAWEGFFHALRTASQAALSDGRADWAKLQSLFGLVRMMGGSETLAFTLQWTLAGTTAVLLCLLWRSRAPFNLKAAGLAVGVLLVPPYLFMYDFVTLAVAMAFLFREMQTSGARTGETSGLGVALLLVLIFPFVKAPVGFIAAMIVAVLIVRRVLWLVSRMRCSAPEVGCSRLPAPIDCASRIHPTCARCSADPGPPRYRMVSVLQRTASRCYALRCVWDTRPNNAKTPPAPVPAPAARSRAHAARPKRRPRDTRRPR